MFPCLRSIDNHNAMSYSKYSHSDNSSDEPLHKMMSLSLGSCQGYRYETIMIQDALTTSTQPRNKKITSDKILKLQLGALLFFVGIILTLGIIIPPQPEVSNVENKVAPNTFFF